MKINVSHKDFDRCEYVGSWAKKVWRDGKKTDEQDTIDGVPVWSVKAEICQGESVEEIIVSVPCKRNPAEGLQRKEQIAFGGLTIESGQRYNGGRWETLSASGIVRKKRTENG